MEKKTALIYLFILVILSIVFTVMGCSVPRLSAPSADDLAGSPIVHKITVPK